MPESSDTQIHWFVQLIYFVHDEAVHVKVRLEDRVCLPFNVLH